jgi:hypothetical protein
MRKLVSLFVVLSLLVALASSAGVANAQSPTEEPTAEPTEESRAEPTEEPTVEPTEEPTAEPTEEPTAEPTVEPTEEPTAEPTAEPTEEPTEEPTVEPTEEPTVEPTEEPTAEPTVEPTVEASIGGTGAGEIDAQALGTFSTIIHVQNKANTPTNVIVDWKNETTGASISPATDVTIQGDGQVTIDGSGVTGGGTVNSGGGIPSGLSRGSAVVTADNQGVAVVVDVVNSGGVMDSYQGFSAGMDTAYLPVMHANNWHQTIAVQNAGTSAAGYTIRFFNEDGSERVADQITVADNTLPVGASQYYEMDNIISGSWAGAAVVEATAGDLIAVASNEYFLDLVTNSTPVMDISYEGLPDTEAANRLFFPVTHNFYPGYFNGWMTFMSVQNVGGSPIDITCRYLNTDGSTAHTVTKTNITSNAAAFFWAKDYTANLGSAYVGSAVVTCEPSATCQMVGIMDDYIQYQSPATSILGGVGYFKAGSLASGATKLYFPSVRKNTASGGINATVVVQNLDEATTANVTVSLYDQNGALLRSFPDTIPPGANNWWSTAFNNPDNSAPTTNTFMNGLANSYVAGVVIESTNGRPMLGTGNEYIFPQYMQTDLLTYWNGVPE